MNVGFLVNQTEILFGNTIIANQIRIESMSSFLQMHLVVTILFITLMSIRVKMKTTFQPLLIYDICQQ